MVRKISFCILATFLSMNLYADEIASYTAIKYHVNYEKQNPKSQESLQKEYQKIKRLSKTLEATVMKNDTDVEVAKNLAIIEIWSNKFMQSYKPSEAELNELYKTEKPRTVGKYELRNILVSYEKNADRIIEMLNEIKNKQDAIEIRNALIKVRRDLVGIGEDEYLISDLIGIKVYDIKGDNIHVYELDTTDLLSLTKETYYWRSFEETYYKKCTKEEYDKALDKIVKHFKS